MYQTQVEDIMSVNKEEGFEMQAEFLQPWSTFVMKTKLPSPILEKMIKISDEIVENRAGSSDEVGAGEMEDQFLIDLKILEQEDLMGFFLDVCNNFIIQSVLQAYPFDKEMILKEHWMTHLNGMWINSQKDNEYFPIHSHRNCNISTVMYLKIPEYLPSRKSYNHPPSIYWNNTNRTKEDGAIIFTNNVSKDPIWGVPDLKVQPQVGDFFIFTGTQRHQVYPFRTADGKGERRSVSFNAVFSSETEQNRLKTQQQVDVSDAS